MSDASFQRNVQLRMRADLEVMAVDRDALDLTYVVKDPVSLRYVRLRPDEYFVLKQLDGKTSLEQIRKRYLDEFPMQRARYSDFEQLLHRFHQLGLVIAQAEGQGDQLLDRGVTEVRNEWLGRFANFLFIRFPGVDPEPFLAATYPLVRWIFSPLAMGLSVLAMAWALLLVLMNFEAFQADMPAIDQIFRSQNMLVMLGLISLTKVAHELGHAFTCKHFGRECHEIGPMWLVMTPAMYCDTSDSWLLPSRWQRIAVAAGGMYVELLLATLATFIWWWTEPGTLHFLSVRVMLICSVSTVLFNANPLLRYDGYYILSDLSRVPNLAQEASSATLAWLRQVGLGMEESRKQLVASRWFLTSYAFASAAYRWVFVLSIVFFVSKALEKNELRGIGTALAFCAVAGMLMMPAKQAYQFFESPSRRRGIKRGRLMVSLMVCLAILGVILFVPLPHRVFGNAELKSSDRATIFITSQGFIAKQIVKPGAKVQKGDVLLRLRNDDLGQREASLRQLVSQHTLTVENLETLQIQHPEFAAQLPPARSALDDARQQHKRAVDRLATLKVKARDGGVYVSASSRSSRRNTRELPRWKGLPTDSDNLGALLDSGTEVGSIQPADAALAVLILEQTDIPYVEPGQAVACWIRGYDELFYGEVVEVSKRDVQEVSQRLSAASGGGVALSPESPAMEFHSNRPMYASYYARVRLETERPILPGTRGYGRIDVGSESIAQKLRRKVATTFRLR